VIGVVSYLVQYPVGAVQVAKGQGLVALRERDAGPLQTRQRRKQSNRSSLFAAPEVMHTYNRQCHSSRVAMG
jgi:hypothetical protein